MHICQCMNEGQEDAYRLPNVAPTSKKLKGGRRGEELLCFLQYVSVLFGSFEKILLRS